MRYKPRSLDELDYTPVGSVYPSPADWRDHFIYFLMVDRFHNESNNVPPYAPGITPTGRNDEDGDKWQGGSLKGIAAKLDYIKGLGCTAIWLSPVFKNRMELDTYHGYGVQNFLDIDPHFGTVQDLQALVKKAHKMGLYVILDVVLNHTGDNWGYEGGWPYYYDQGQRFPFGSWRGVDSRPGIQWPHDSVWPLEFQEPEWYRRKGEIRNWDTFPEARDGDFCSLKELDTSRREVVEALVRAYKYWIAVADVDGFRLDAVKHLEQSNIALFCSAVREYALSIGKKNFLLFGEIVGDDRFIEQYVGRNSFVPGSSERFFSLDAALDFPLWQVLEGVIKGFTSPGELRKRYDRCRESYRHHGEAEQCFVTFIDNHDQIGRIPRARFLHNNPFPKQAVLAMGYLLTSMGIPCIYYGTEQGFDGGGSEDKYIRECMFGGTWGAFDTTGYHFHNPDHYIYKSISAIAKVRQNECALRYGRLYFREISVDGRSFDYPVDGRCTMAYSRILDRCEILVALNLDSSGREDFVTVDSNLSPAGRDMTNLLDPRVSMPVVGIEGRNAVRIPLGPHEMGIFKMAL